MLSANMFYPNLYSNELKEFLFCCQKHLQSIIMKLLQFIGPSNPGRYKLNTAALQCCSFVLVASDVEPINQTQDWVHLNHLNNDQTLLFSRHFVPDFSCFAGCSFLRRCRLPAPSAWPGVRFRSFPGRGVGPRVGLSSRAPRSSPQVFGCI